MPILSKQKIASVEGFEPAGRRRAADAYLVETVDTPDSVKIAARACPKLGHCRDTSEPDFLCVETDARDLMPTSAGTALTLVTLYFRGSQKGAL
jgi:hypothetical protein